VVQLGALHLVDRGCIPQPNGEVRCVLGIGVRVGVLEDGQRLAGDGFLEMRRVRYAAKVMADGSDRTSKRLTERSRIPDSNMSTSLCKAS
jgi:hypothetical protein